jgi:RNA polymerase sigma factor (sigma-70 family)
MATVLLEKVVRHIRRLTADPKIGEQTDAVLLSAFLSRNDHAAFEVLVRRHGPMVLRVCLRTLGCLHDAEDALQATFLVLARQAASIRKKTSLASWLHGVAHRMAIQARKAASRRHKYESNASPGRPPDPARRAAWQELAAFIDEEIQRLPQALRTPFVSCCLQNRSCAETARLLGIQEGAVRMRLSRARQRLQRQLKRRGVSLTSVLAASVLGANDALAALPGPLVASAVRAAARIAAGEAITGKLISANVAVLTAGALKAMFLAKVKVGAMVVVASVLAIAGALMAGLHALPAMAQAPPQAAEKGDSIAVQSSNLASSKPDKEAAVTYVDLQPNANQKITETFRDAAFQANHLGELKLGTQTLEGLKFNIGEGMIFLANEKHKDSLPAKVEGIKIDAKFAQLQILHATAYTADEDTVIARYIVHYDDKTDETIEIVYGVDVRDWWYHDGDKEPSRGKVAWKGSNAPAQSLKCSLWLFSRTWKNPHPDKRVVSIDFVSMVTGAAPFVLAMTLESRPQTREQPQRSTGAPAIGASALVSAPTLSAPELKKEPPRKSPIAAAIEQVEPALVFIQESREKGAPESKHLALALGIIIDPKGTVVTNHSVIKCMKKSEVILSDGRRLPAKAVLADSGLDLAIITVEDAGPLPFAAVGDSDKVKVGSPVFALSAPWITKVDQPLMVAAAIVGGKARRTEQGDFLFLVDTTFGPGCGPGPLLSREGRFLGLVVSRDLSPRCNAAIPSNQVQERLAQWAKKQLE